MLQSGIYWDHQRTPPRCWCTFFLRVSDGAKAQDVDVCMRQLWAMWRELTNGRIRDLPGQDVSSSDLEVLLGYGPNAFSVDGVRREAPRALADHLFRRPTPGGNEILPGSMIRYAPGIARNPATEEFLVQGTAATPLAVSRLVVETAKLLADLTPPGGEAALHIATAFTGFNREDHRSWIDFHDGTSNLRAGQDRNDVIVIKLSPEVSDEDRWTVGGTYLTFMRLSVDLSGWRTLSVAEQEFAVGRMKLTGCPVVNAAANGSPMAAPGCPFAGTANVHDGDNSAYFEPPFPVAATEFTHVQRANHHIELPLSRRDSFRVFRQGYEFFEPPQLDRPMQLGLNFVSFQDTPERLFHMLTMPDWLADVNFGGRIEQQPPTLANLLTCHAAGVYLVPPVLAGEAYPGQSLFSDH